MTPVTAPIGRLQWLQLAILPLVIAVSGCQREPARLELSPSHLHLKYSKDTSEQDIDIRLRNAGQRQLEVLAVRASCSCTVARMPKKRQLRPGEETTLRLAASPPMFGVKHADVMIRTSSEATPAVMVRLTLEGGDTPIPHIHSQPDRLELRGTTGGEPLTGEIEVRTIEDAKKPHWITGLLSSRDSCSAKLNQPVDETKIDDQLVSRCYRVDVSVSCPENGHLVAKLTPVLRDSAAARSLLVTATRIENLQVVPSEINLGGGSQDLGSIHVIAQDNHEFEITEVTIVGDSNELPIHVDPSEPRKSHTLSLRPALDDTDSLVNVQHIEIATTHPDAPVVHVPFRRSSARK